MPRFLTHNWSWKLASLAVAVALWFLVVGEPELVTVEAVPLVYGNLASNMVLLSDPPDSVRLELRGPSREIATGNLSQLKVLLDFSSVDQPGDRMFVIQESQLDLPAGVAFQRAVPPQLNLTFDRLEARELPVIVDVKGSPVAGLRALAPVAIPPTVRITGPASVVDRIAAIPTEPIDVTGRSESFQVVLQPLLAEPGLRIDPPIPLSARVTIEKGNSPPE